MKKGRENWKYFKYLNLFCIFQVDVATGELNVLLPIRLNEGNAASYGNCYCH